MLQALPGGISLGNLHPVGDAADMDQILVQVFRFVADVALFPHHVAGCDVEEFDYATHACHGDTAAVG